VIAVLPAHQGTGVQGAPCSRSPNARRCGKAASIYLYTNEKMTENRALYQRIGYVESSARCLRRTSVYLRSPYDEPCDAARTRFDAASAPRTRVGRWRMVFHQGTPL
jgi:hypothetical protein